MQIINGFARAVPNATFVQVGANDGDALDPLQEAIARTSWTGVMVEPVPYVFKRLSANMAGNHRVALANVAIADEDGVKDFYHLAEAAPGDDVWPWYHALGSFNRDVLLSHVEVIPDIESRIITTPVPCVTFDSLCEQYSLTRVDVIQIDTEGYDDVVLGLIDLARYRPQVVMYERIHLEPESQARLLKRLRAHGYEVFNDSMDTVAVHRDTLDRYPSIARTMRSAQRSYDSMMGGSSMSSGQRRSVPDLSPKRLVQQGMFRLGYKVQRLSEEERSAFVQFQRPDPAAIRTVFGADAARLQELRERYARFDSPVAVHSIWAARGADENLADIGLAGVDLTRFRASSSYVWNYYAGNEDVARLQYYVFGQAVKATDAAGLLQALDEDGAFGCPTYVFKDLGRVSRDLLDSVAEINFLERHLGILGHPDLHVLDIGAGYGRMAHRILEAKSDVASYTCVDAIPESTFLCEYYLKNRGLLDRATVVPIDEVEQALEGKAYDLALNIHSFSECTYAAIEWWLRRVRQLAVPHVMIIPNEEGEFVSTESDGARRDYLPLLEELGYQLIADEPLLDDTVRDVLGVMDRMYLFALDPRP